MQRKAISVAGLVLIGASLLIFLEYQLRTMSNPFRLHTSESDSESVAGGDLAADFHLKDLQGQVVSLSSLKGRVVFLNFWATWCGPCREEMPSMETLYNEFKGNRDFVMLAVSQDRKVE